MTDGYWQKLSLVIPLPGAGGDVGGMYLKDPASGESEQHYKQSGIISFSEIRNSKSDFKKSLTFDFSILLNNE